MSQETLYIVRDPAGAIYGPANVGTLQQWIGEGRITSQMHVALQGTQDFQVAGEMPELHSAFNPAPASAATTVPVTRAITAPTQGSYNQNYQGAATGAPNYYGYAASRSSGLAIAALICGCGSFFCGASAIAAVIMGHIARGQIRREPERYDGHGMATAGMIIGYVYLSLVAAIVLIYIVIIVIAVGAAGAAGGR